MARLVGFSETLISSLSAIEECNRADHVPKLLGGMIRPKVCSFCNLSKENLGGKASSADVGTG
jgi:hypothetical protein